MLRQQVTSHSRAYFIPKLQYQFAEFLNYSSSIHLRIFSSHTCVGLRYGLITISLRSFSWKLRVTHFALRLGISSQCLNRPADLPTSPTYDLTPQQPICGCATFLRHSFSQTIMTKYRNINLLSIDYAFRPRLRFRLTLGGFTWPRNPCVYGGRDSRPPYRYSFQHQLLWDLQRSLRYAFISTHNALLPLKKVHSFGTTLKPRYIFGAEPLVQ